MRQALFVVVSHLRGCTFSSLLPHSLECSTPPVFPFDCQTLRLLFFTSHHPIQYTTPPILPLDYRTLRFLCFTSHRLLFLLSSGRLTLFSPFTMEMERDQQED
jgi:hypothetical protein